MIDNRICIVHVGYDQIMAQQSQKKMFDLANGTLL